MCPEGWRFQPCPRPPGEEREGSPAWVTWSCNRGIIRSKNSGLPNLEGGSLPVANIRVCEDSNVPSAHGAKAQNSEAGALPAYPPEASSFGWSSRSTGCPLGMLTRAGVCLCVGAAPERRGVVLMGQDGRLRFDRDESVFFKCDLRHQRPPSILQTPRSRRLLEGSAEMASVVKHLGQL